ncbi:hypothetical protein HDU98_006628, partial [Podochytrium sp. JEL0797]
MVVHDLTALAVMWRINHTGTTATRADKHGWILQNMYRPLSGRQLLDDPFFKVLDMATDKDGFAWDANGFLSEEQMPKSPENTNSSLPTPSDPAAQLFRITPSTRIYAMCLKYRVAIVVDVSASMRVVDTNVRGLNRCLIPLCFETLCNCLDGISRPYAIKNSWTGELYEIYVTVLAKAGASMGYRPDLSPRAHAYIMRHPVHAILQDVQINSGNLFNVTEWLYHELNAYENEMISLRHMDDKKHALYALRLIPADCKPVVIVLTDGVSMSLMKGEFIYRDVCRRLSKELVNVSIIQVGSNSGFYPGVNFGYVPDNEALRFLAMAAFGKFFYASDCRYLDPPFKTDGTVHAQPVASPPNFYHRTILIRETLLKKSKNVDLSRFVAGPERPVDTPRVRFINSNMEASMISDASPESDYHEIVFPWHLESLPPIVGEILCGFKDYEVESRDLTALIHMRLLEGFAVKSIHIGSGSQRKHHSGGKAAEKVEIILMRPWLPHVTIQYTIKARFVFDWESSKKTFVACAIEGKVPIIELNILAHHSFAVNFVNSAENANLKNERIQKLQNYLLGIWESDAVVHLLVGFTDKSVMTSFPKFDYSRIFSSAGGQGGWGMGATSTSVDPDNIWNVMCSFMVNKSTSFDDWDRDVVLRSSNPNRVLAEVSSAYPSGVFNSRPSAGGKYNPAGEAQGRSRLPSSLIHIMNFLATQWSSFTVNRTTFVKFYPDEQAPTGFTMLRLVYETDWLLSMRMSFFNVPVHGRQKMADLVCTELSGLSVPCSYTKSDSSSPVATYTPLKICAKPIRRMLIRYRVKSEDVAEALHRVKSEDSSSEPPPISLVDIVSKAEKSGLTAHLISPVGPRSYLRSYRWVWLADVDLAEHSSFASSTLFGGGTSKMEGGQAMSILDLALHLLYFARLEEGYLLVSQLQDSVTMYREIVVQKPFRLLDSAGNEIRRNSLFENVSSREIACGVQYIILVDRVQRTIVTELWVEPVIHGTGDPNIPPLSKDVHVLFQELHEPIAHDVVEADSRLFDSLFTFDRIHNIARSYQASTPVVIGGRKSSRVSVMERQSAGGVCDAPGTKVMEVSEPGRATAIMQTNLSIESVLQNAEFWAMLFSPPIVTGNSAEESGGTAFETASEANFSPLAAFKSEGDLLSRGLASPSGTLDSPRGSISNDLMFHRRSSHFAPKPPAPVVPVKPVLSIGVNWDMLVASSPQARTRLLLFKFFQDAMNATTDGEVKFKLISATAATATRRKLSKSTSEMYEPDVLYSSGVDGNLLERIHEILAKSYAALEVLVPRFEESVCFVKLRRFDEFYLTFVPKVVPVADLYKGEAMAVTVVRCRRKRVSSNVSGRERLAPVGFDRCVTGQNTNKFNWELLKKEGESWSDGVVVLKGDTGSVVVQKKPAEEEDDAASAEYVDNFMTSVGAAFANAHCKSVYAGLLQNLEMSAEDVEKALASCVEIAVDVDLTSYLNVLTLRHKVMKKDDVRLEKTNILNAVRSRLSQYFKQVTCLPNQKNMYFYDPDDGSDGCVTPSRLDCADSPLFIRSECSFRKSNLSQSEGVLIPSVAIPTSYVVSDLTSWNVVEPEDDPYTIDFSPRVIGTEESPLQSVDGTVATLQLVCLCLIKPTKFDATYDDTVELHERELDDPRLVLTADKVAAFYKTVDLIKEILEDEIMNGLLELPSKAEKFTVEHIKDCLSLRHPIPSNFGIENIQSIVEPASSCICDFPLVFIHDTVSPDMVTAEFAKVKVDTGSISIQRLKEYFCIMGCCDWGDAVDPVDGLDPALRRESSYSESIAIDHGLGISLAPEEFLTQSLHIDSSKKNWVLLSFKHDYARVWFFSRFVSADERAGMLRWIHKAIEQTCDRVNKLLLLRQLMQRHRANRLLIDRRPIDETSDDEDEEDEKMPNATAQSFAPNMFSCPLVFSRQFSIHWRVKPSLALNAAVSSITILAITNRKGMFVFEADGIIVYFRLSIKGLEGDSQTVDPSRSGSVDELSLSVGSLPKADPLSVLNASPKVTSPPSGKLRTPMSAPMSHYKASPESFLLLEFFGVDTPGPSMTAEFVNMVDSKLNSLTQREIGTYMSRNMKAMRLTPADVDFILPISKRPQKREFFKIPQFLDCPFKFLLFLKQAMLAELNSLPANDIASVLTSYYDKTYGIAYSDVDLTKGVTQDVNFGEFAFLYNSLSQRGASFFETSVGAGTAVICLSLLDTRRKVVGTVTEPLPPTHSYTTKANDLVYETLRDRSDTLRITEYDMCFHDDSPFILAVEIWSHGSLSSDTLLEFSFKCYRDSILHYFTESSVAFYSNLLASSRPASSLSQLSIAKALANSSVTRKVDPSFGEFFDQMLDHLKVSAQLSDCAVEELSSPIKLPAALMDSLALETNDLLLETSSAFHPVMISRKSVAPGLVELDIYTGKSGRVHEASERQILVVAGLQALQDMYGCPTSGKTTPSSSGVATPTKAGSFSEHSMDSSMSDFVQRNPLRGSNAGLVSGAAITDSRHTNMDNIMTYPSTVLTTAKGFGTRSGFFLMLIEANRISAATYNLSKATCAELFKHILRILSWNNIRMQYLEHGFGLDTSGDPFRADRYPSQTLKPPSGVDYSSSYAGIGGMGHAAMKHFEARRLVSDVPEVGETDHLRQMYNVNANSLQKSAVALLDSYVRRLGHQLGALDSSKSDVSLHRGKVPGYISNQPRADEFLRNSRSRSSGCIDGDTPLSTADLAAVLRSVRLHFVHYPIFFSTLRDSLLNPDDSPVSEIFGDEAAGQDAVTNAWFHCMLSKFSADYAGYLASLEFEPLDVESHKSASLEEWSSHPVFSVSKDVKIEFVPQYFVKCVSGGVFILQIGVDGFCVSVNLYMLKFPSGPLNVFDEGMRYGAEKESDKQFKSDCNYFKAALHVHSFSYDFHIRYFQHILDHQPNCKVDLLDVMKTFEIYNSSRFVYARSRMLSGECLTDAHNLTASLFQYILKNPRIYGFKSLAFDGEPTACFLTSEFPDFAIRHSQFERGPFCYTVVIYNQGGGSAAVDKPDGGASSKETKLKLRYFLLIIDRENAFPLQGLEGKTQSFVNQSHSEKLKEYLSGGCYLGDIAKFAEKKIETLVEMAIRYYDRDGLWRQLNSNKHPTTQTRLLNHDSDDGVYEWSKMFLEKISPNSRCLLQMEPSLLNVFGNPRLPWPQIMQFLQHRFSETVRQIYEDPKLGRKHVVFFNPMNSDFLIHVIYWKVNASGLPLPLTFAEGGGGWEGEMGEVEVGGLMQQQKVNLNPMQRRVDEDDRLSLKARLRALESLGVKLARPGEYQIDVWMVNREGFVGE